MYIYDPSARPQTKILEFQSVSMPDSRDSNAPGFQDSRIQRFQISEFQDFKIPGSQDSRIPEFWDSKCPNSKVAKFRSTRIQGFHNSEIAKFQNSKIWVHTCSKMFEIVAFQDFEVSQNNICQKWIVFQIIWSNLVASKLKIIGLGAHGHVHQVRKTWKLWVVGCSQNES